MTKYWYYAGDYYYPQGGIDNLKGVFNTLGEAQAKRDEDIKIKSQRLNSYYDWWRIIEVADSVPRRHSSGEFSS